MPSETRANAGVPGDPGRRLCAQHRDGAVPLLRLKRSQLARAQAFAARDLAARCPFWLFGM
jgi:hypothetical protein